MFKTLKIIRLTSFKYRLFSTLPEQATTTTNTIKSVESQKPKIKFDYVYGINPVATAIYANRRKLLELNVSEKVSMEDNYRVQNIINQAHSLKLPVKFLPKDKLEKMCQHQPHQGVILKCHPIPYVRVGEVEDLYCKEGKNSGYIWTFFDQITDPQNFGAVIRASYFLGADGILADEENRCPLTPTVSKTSAGALELMEINCVKNPKEFLSKAKKEGWRIVVTTVDNTKTKLKEISDLSVQVDDNIILVLGSEFKGVNKAIQNIGTDLVYIGNGFDKEKSVFPYTLVDSLNVSVACGISLKIIKDKMKIIN